MVGLFRTVLFILIFYYLFRFISRHILPLFRKQPDTRRQDVYGQNRRPEGDIRVEGNNQKGVRRDEGEYVDFEEID